VDDICEASHFIRHQAAVESFGVTEVREHRRRPQRSARYYAMYVALKGVVKGLAAILKLHRTGSWDETTTAKAFRERQRKRLRSSCPTLPEELLDMAPSPAEWKQRAEERAAELLVSTGGRTSGTASYARNAKRWTAPKLVRWGRS